MYRAARARRDLKQGKESSILLYQKPMKQKKSVCDKRIIDAGVKRARTCPKGKEMYAYEKWKTHVRDVRSRLKHKCKLATIRPSKEGGRKEEKRKCGCYIYLINAFLAA